MSRIVRLAILALVMVARAAGAETATPTLTAEQMRQDLQYLRDVWTEQDRSFGPQTRAKFTQAIDAATADANSLTPADFSLRIARALALAGNGHTSARLGAGFQGLPIHAVWFDDGLYIVRAHPSQAKLLGARIDAFGTLTAQQAFDRVKPFVSGTDAHARVIGPDYLRLIEVLHHIGATSSTRQVKLRLTLANGKTQSVILKPTAAADTEKLPPHLQLIRRRGDADAAERWPHVLDRVNAIPSVYEQVVDVATESLPGEERALYIRSNMIESPSDSPLSMEAKLWQVFDQIVKDQPRFVVMDLRFNHGGNLLLTILFANGLPRVVPDNGKVFVLVGARTYSAALATAAMLKGSGRDKVVLVGESMGDNPQFWSDGREVLLPNSHLAVTPATTYHDWENGCDGQPNCFWANATFAKPGVSLQPAIKVATRFSDYVSGRDAVLDAALAAAHNVVTSEQQVVSSLP